MKNLTDMNALYDAFLASMKGSAWKEEPQRFEIDFLTELTKLSSELENRTYKTTPSTIFVFRERGKERLIHGGRMRDRVVRHALCDNELTPKLKPYLIYNNGASQKNKGISFARTNFENDLHSYWLEHRSNVGYVGFIDLSKFYDNMQHDIILQEVCPKISEGAAWLLTEVLKTFEVDVSYMTDEEYERCMSEKFDSIKYYNTVPEELRTGKRYMRKSVDIGDQVSQDLGVFFPTRIDNYAKIVRGCKRYGRYMDDIYVIGETREEVRSVIDGIKEQADNLGLFINERKTYIAKLSDTYRYLQIRYSLTDTGRVIRRIGQKNISRERRKIKAYRRLVDAGRITEDNVEECFRSWLGMQCKYMSNIQIINMIKLYHNLFRRNLTWKTNSRLRYLTEQSLKTSD